MFREAAIRQPISYPKTMAQKSSLSGAPLSWAAAIHAGMIPAPGCPAAPRCPSSRSNALAAVALEKAAAAGVRRVFVNHTAEGPRLKMFSETARVILAISVPCPAHAAPIKSKRHRRASCLRAGGMIEGVNRAINCARASMVVNGHHLLGAEAVARFPKFSYRWSLPGTSL